MKNISFPQFDSHTAPLDGNVKSASDRRYLVTRRSLVRLLFGAVAGEILGLRLRAAPGIPVDRLVLDHAPESPTYTHCRYRAHAQVHLLSIPVFSRQDVGGGYAVVEEAGSGAESITGLQFAGGSTPGRTRGLNRVGFIQEAVVERNGIPVESAYFGFIVASGEKNLDQARKSLQTETAESVGYAAAFGSGRAGRFECTLSHLPVPSRYNWQRFDQLNGVVRTLMKEAPDTTRVEVPLETASSVPNTFLYSIRRAILSEDRHMAFAIVYNGKRYRLATERTPDPRSGNWRLNGTLSEPAARMTSNFQVWYEKGNASGLPVRIEFHPKSFLTLVFERDVSDDGPKFSYMLKK